MARIGDLWIGGREEGRNASVCYGVAFALSQDPSIDLLLSLNGWETEVKAGQRSVVARTSRALSTPELLAAGLEYAQRILDVIAFETSTAAVVVNPGDAHIAVIAREGDIVLRDTGLVDYGIRSSTEVIVKDAAGNLLRQASPPPVWVPGLRFYRLSQAAKDLFDAYRNLFLGLEALLDAVCPKKPKEGVRKWLMRALRQIEQQAGLAEVTPRNVASPVHHIIESQYDRIRLRLFHTKAIVTGSLDIPEPWEVARAYEDLVRIWRQIAERCFAVRRGGGGVVTNAGFKMLMDLGRPDESVMYFSDDNSPATDGDIAVSPEDRPAFAFDTTTYLSETSPGRVAFLGSTDTRVRTDVPVIHRVAVTMQGTLFLVNVISEGLNVSGVDTFESLQTVRLRNLDHPRTTFGEAASGDRYDRDR